MIKIKIEDLINNINNHFTHEELLIISDASSQKIQDNEHCPSIDVIQYTYNGITQTNTITTTKEDEDFITKYLTEAYENFYSSITSIDSIPTLEDFTLEVNQNMELPYPNNEDQNQISWYFHIQQRIKEYHTKFSDYYKDLYNH